MFKRSAFLIGRKGLDVKQRMAKGGGAGAPPPAIPPDMADDTVAWPERTRRIDPTTLSTTGTAAADRVSIDGEVLVPSGDYSGGIEISLDGAADGNWVPLMVGVVYPLPQTTRRSRSIHLRRAGTGAGTIVLLGFHSVRMAYRLAKHISSSAASFSMRTSGANPSGQFVSVVAPGAAVANQTFTRAAGNIGSLVVNRGAGIIYLAETSAKATTAAGVQIPPGASRKWFGPLFYASDAATTFDVQEDLT